MNKKKGLIIGIITLFAISVFGIVFAATDTNLGTALGLIPDKNYAVDVIDDGAEGDNIPSDENIDIRTVVLDSDQVTTEMILETRITNKNELKNKQVAIVMDTSYSMDINAEGYNIKTIAKELVNKIYAEVSDLSVSVTDCSGIRANMTKLTNTSNVNTINAAIDNVSGGYNVADALAYAKSTLTPNSNTEAYVIVFTDATDDVDFSLFSNSQMQESQKISVYSILTGITSSAFGTPEEPATDGKVYMIDEYVNDNKKQEIVYDFNKAVKNTNTTIKFNEDILKTATRGNFKLEIIDDETNGTAIQNSDGTISWTVNDVLKTSNTWKIKYKLKLNTVSTISSDTFYNDINIIKQINTTYTPYNKRTENTVDSENIRPTIQICDAYDLKIKAVGEGTTVPVSGAKFSVIGIDEDGNTLVTKTGLVTDNNGMIAVDSIKYKGKVNFTVIPEIENLLGYEETDPITVLIDNQYSDEGGWLSISYDGELDEDEQNLYGNGERYATIVVPIKLQKFKIVLDVFDINDPEGKLPDIDFRLIQPKLNNKYEMDALYGTTNRNGKIEFEASIMSQAGTYDYVLSQMSDKTGYDNFGNATIKITFDDMGKVVEDGVEAKYNSNIEGIKNSDSEVLLKIKEKCTSSSIFGMKINLTNEDNVNEKIEGSIYEIQVTKIDDSNSTNETLTYTKSTDSEGVINLSSVATETGYTKIDIHQVSTNNGYILETVDKEIIINRQNGIIYEVTVGGQFARKNPDNNNGIIVNLTNKKKNELNVVKIHLTEKEDRTMNLTNVGIQLVNKDNSSDILSAVTNSEGCANFVLPDTQTIQDGTYYYQVILDEVPAGYYEPDVIGTIRLSIIDGKVTEITDVTLDGEYKPIFDEHTETNINSREVQYVGMADYLLTADSSSTSYLKIHLTDATDGKNIEYGKYEVTMERNGSQIANAGSVGKFTDSNGITSKMSIPGLDSEPVTITISQVYDNSRQNGYKIDTNIYTIVVRKESDGTINLMSVTQADGSELPIGTNVTFESIANNGIMNMIVFNNQNTLIDPGDIILDFSVVKYDKATDQPMQQQDLIVWSDDVLIFNPETGDYEELTKDNPLNPMQTGVNLENLSPGQIQLKMKPKDLPEVKDTNKDGYPVASILIHIGEYDENTGEAIDGTDCGVRFILTYSKVSGTYKYTGYSKDVGAAILKDFLHSNSENTAEGYVISGIVDLYSNVGEASNFAIDMSKYNYLEQELPDAKYKVKVVSPTGRFITLTQTVINGANTVEIPNVYVQEGSIITFVEDEAPIGYELDTVEGAFIVKKVDESTGVVTLEAYGEENPRIKLGNSRISTQNGTSKFIQQIRLEDLEKNNMKVTVKTKDKTTGVATERNSFKIVTNTGSSAITKVTNEEGETSAYVGGEKQKDYMTYTISQRIEDETETARFYKRLSSNINLKIYFDENKNIVNDPLSPNSYGMLNANSLGYNDWWYVEGVSEKEITIVILQDREDPLNVSIKTVDKYSGQTLTGQTLIDTVSYSITPTEVVGSIDGKGYSDVKVGFVDPGNTIAYNLKPDIAKNYIGLQDQQFIVTYDQDGNVAQVNVPPSSTAIQATARANTKYIDVTVTIEPAVPFVIHNVDLYYDSTKDDLNLQNAQFTIEREDHQYDEDGLYRTADTGNPTGAEGKTVIYTGNFGEGTSEGNKKYVYTVKQNTAAKKGIKDDNGNVVETQDYARVEDFKIEVEYNSNNEIVGANLFENTSSTDRFVKQVTFKQPSENGNWGYNGNNKGIVYIEIRNDVAFNINLVNTDRTTDQDASNVKELSGATYKITSDIPTSGTGTAYKNNEIASIGYADRTLFGKTVTYEIEEINPANGYQKLASKIKVEVDFDSDGHVNLNSSNPVRIIEGSEYAKITTLTPDSDNTKAEYRNNFGIKLTIRSTPIFRINIDNIDRKKYNVGMTTNLAGAKYSITSDFDTNAEVEKTTVNTLVAMLGSTPLNQDVNYTIHEINPAQDYQSIEKDIKVKVHFDTNGIVESVNLDAGNSAYATVNTIANIVNSEDNLTVNLTIRNNPLIKFNLNKINEDSQPLSNAKFSVEARVKGTDDVIYEETLTTVSGIAPFRIDRALDSKTIVYTLKEDKNPVGYEYMDSNLTIEVVYDEQGKIAKKENGEYRITITPDVDWAEVTDAEDYGFDINIIDEQIKDIGINLNVYDKYDQTKRAQNAKIKAYFAKDGASYNEDTDHSATLISGIDENNDGTPDFGYGQDYKTIGKAKGIESATLVLKEIEVPDSYYDTLYAQTKENIYMSWGYYQIRSGRIELTFTDEGKVASVNVASDSLGSTALGKCLDGQYLKAYINDKNPYMIDIELYYYPMLEMTINAKADSSYSKTENLNENELIGTYDIYNRKRYSPGVGISIYNNRDQNLANGMIDAGYIGQAIVGGTDPFNSNQGRDSKVFNEQTNSYEANNFALWPGEQYNVNSERDKKNNGRERYLYIHEPGGEVSEPASNEGSNYSSYGQLQYQQHGTLDYSPNYTSYNADLIGAIKVTYNERGEIEKAELIDDQASFSRNRRETEDGSQYISVEISDNKHGIIVNIEYKRTTTIEAKVVDEITGTEITDVTLRPGLGGTASTNRKYKYTTIFEQNLARDGKTWTYWGGNDANGSKTYSIGTSFNNAQAYNGYDVIGNVDLEIHYDEYGFIDIDSSRVLSTNAAGKPNAEITATKDKIYLTIIATRKFDMQIDVKDKFDSSKTISEAKFSITSNKTDIRGTSGYSGTLTNVSQGKRTQVGVIHAKQTVRYTISETYTPEDYIPINDIAIDVVFEENGAISQVITSDGITLYNRYGTGIASVSDNVIIKVISVDEARPGLKPRDINDLRIEITNYPKIKTNVVLTDKFYTKEGIAGAEYDIKDSTNNVKAAGDLITNSDGKINTYTGTAYPQQTIRYTFNQSKTPTGYYDAGVEDVVDITYDDNGYFLEVTRVAGNSEYDWSIGERTFTLKPSNMPKDIKIGIDKDLAGVSFKITKEEIGESQDTLAEYDVTTGNKGTVVQVADTFTKKNDATEYLYTISETQQLDGYRKVPDTEFRIRYNPDGSIDYLQEDTQNSNVKITLARGKFQTLSSGEKVHIKVAIVNDDKYNLTIIDEAKDINGVKVEGTKYKVEINNNELTSNELESNVTDSTGSIVIPNRSEMGQIKFTVSELSAGTGYRSNILNSAEILIDKGIETYSLTLNQSNFAKYGYVATDPVDIFDNEYKRGIEYTITLNTNSNTQEVTDLILRIFEDTGNITMTFKNETMSILNVKKIDSEDPSKVLEGAEFKITAEEVDSFGNSQLADGEEPTVITESATTDVEGKIRIDLGNRLVNKRIKYTFEELTAPKTYLKIEPVSIIYSYDINGKITSIQSQSPKRIAGAESWNDVNVTIKNGDVDTYSVKVVMIDSKKGSTSIGRSNARINDIPFNITITDEQGSILGRTTTKTSTVTNSFGYEEDGVILIDDLKASGKIFVSVNQTGTIDGYTMGDNKVTGIVTFENEFVPRTTGQGVDATLSNLNDGGFEDSYLDTNEGQVVIKVYNDPQVTLNLHKEDIDTKDSLKDATFTVTSEIDGRNRAATVSTNLNVHTNGTDENGNEKIVIGAPEYGKTVIYTLKEDKMADYNLLDDIKLKVVYNTEGKINDWEMLSDETYAEVKESITVVGEKTFWETPTKEEEAEIARLQNEQGDNSKDPIVNTLDSRQINMVVKNKQSDKVIPYTIEIKVKDELGNPIEGIDINLSLTQGLGGTPMFPIKTTDKNGKVTFAANGSEVLEMKATITNAQKYTFSSNLNAIYFKDPATGYIEGRFYGDFEPQTPDNEKHIIYLETTAKLQDNTFNLTLMKMDKGSGTTITDNPAVFTITREDMDGNSQEQSSEDEQIYNEIIIGSNEQTNDNGLIMISGIDMPEEVGTYNYKVYEIEAPDGYKKIEEPMKFAITFGYNEGGGMVIANAKSNNSELSILNFGRKGVVLGIDNREEVAEDQYMLNIYKIDEETGEKINGAVFKVKLADSNGTYVYTESGENAEKDGQLDYCYIEQEKDYEVRLKHMTRPTVEEIKNSGSQILVHSYTFEEIAAPDGYAVDRTQFVLRIEFEVATDNDGNEYVRIYKNGTESSDDNLLQITDIQEDQISANILNRKQAKEFEINYKLTSDVTENVIDMPSQGIKIAEIPYPIASNIPLREGYTFDSWNTEEDGSGTRFEAGGTYAIDANLVLYAQWKTAEYVVSYEGNAPIDEETGVAIGRVDDVPDSQQKSYFDDLELNATKPKITTLGTKYKFNSWNTKADGSGETYYPGDTYVINESMTLYAQWNFAIKYASNEPLDTEGLPMSEMKDFPQLTPQELEEENKNGGEYIYYREYYSVNEYNDITINNSIPKMDGYKFKEWNTKVDGTGESYKPGYIYKDRKALTLYAIWEYEITYEVNIPLDQNGFNIEATVEDMPENQTENVIEIYNRYNQSTKNNSQDIKYPTVSDKEPYFVPISEDVDIPEYKFVGWNTQPDGSGDSYSPDTIYKGNIGITLYAQWKLEDDLYLKSTAYIIGNQKPQDYVDGSETMYEDGDLYVLGIMPYLTVNTKQERNENNEGTTVKILKDNFNTNATQFKVYDTDGNEITNEDDLVTTGCVLELKLNQTTISLTLIVRGDYGDGKLKLNDYNQFGNYLANGTSAIINDEVKLKAFDVNLDGKINMRDYNLMANAQSNLDTSVFK